MATNYTKIDRGAAFNPTRGFPLDSRSYFESLTEAITAISNAGEAGAKDNTSVYYYGQIISVYENETSKAYIIEKGDSGAVLKEIVSGNNSKETFTIGSGEEDLDEFSTKFTYEMDLEDGEIPSVQVFKQNGENVYSLISCDIEIDTSTKTISIYMVNIAKNSTFKVIVM